MNAKKIRPIVLIVCLSLLIVFVLCLKVRGYLKDQLFQAISYGDRIKVETLLKWDAPVNATTSGKVTYTPLIYNVDSRNDIGIAEVLIKHGADVNAENNSGDTPFHWATARGKKQMVIFLLSYGADVSISNDLGKTQLDDALEELHREEKYEDEVNPEMREIVEILQSKITPLNK